MVAAMWLIGCAIAIVCATWLRPRAGFEGLFIGHALCWTAMSIALALVLPGGAYLALIPAVAFAICTLLLPAEPASSSRHSLRRYCGFRSSPLCTISSGVSRFP